MTADEIIKEVRHFDDTLHIDIWYPRCEDNPIKRIVVGLIDVRAADDIRITYDFTRDGWIIEQASKYQWEESDLICDPDWKEVSFVKAWARERERKAKK